MLKRTKSKVLTSEEENNLKKDHTQGIRIRSLCKQYGIGQERVYKYLRGERVNGDDVEERLDRTSSIAQSAMSTQR